MRAPPMLFDQPKHTLVRLRKRWLTAQSGWRALLSVDRIGIPRFRAGYAKKGILLNIEAAHQMDCRPWRITEMFAISRKCQRPTKQLERLCRLVSWIVLFNDLFAQAEQLCREPTDDAIP
jgi:hypothetical protein